MSTISIIILGFILLIVAGINMMKKSKLTIMREALNIKNYDAVIATSQNSLARKLCSPYICNLYYLRAKFFTLEEDAFIEVLQQVINETPEKTNKKEFLEIYFHIYVNRQQKESAAKLLDMVLDGDDDMFKLVSSFVFEVAFENQSGHVKEIEAAVETLRAFELGAAVYYLGVYYDVIGDFESAIAYYESGLGCFDPSHYYIAQLKERLAIAKEKFEG